jgi:hypothetical protein
MSKIPSHFSLPSNRPAEEHFVDPKVVAIFGLSPDTRSGLQAEQSKNQSLIEIFTGRSIPQEEPQTPESISEKVNQELSSTSASIEELKPENSDSVTYQATVEKAEELVQVATEAIGSSPEIERVEGLRSQIAELNTKVDAIKEQQLITEQQLATKEKLANEKALAQELAKLELERKRLEQEKLEALKLALKSIMKQSDKIVSLVIDAINEIQEIVLTDDSQIRDNNTVISQVNLNVVDPTNSDITSEPVATSDILKKDQEQQVAETYQQISDQIEQAQLETTILNSQQPKADSAKEEEIQRQIGAVTV